MIKRPSSTPQFSSIRTYSEKSQEAKFSVLKKLEHLKYMPPDVFIQYKLSTNWKNKSETFADIVNKCKQTKTLQESSQRIRKKRVALKENKLRVCFSVEVEEQFRRRDAPDTLSRSELRMIQESQLSPEVRAIREQWISYQSTKITDIENKSKKSCQCHCRVF